MLSLRHFGILGIFALFTACAQIPAEHQASNAARAVVESPQAFAASNVTAGDTSATPAASMFRSARRALESGNASWYAAKFQGRRTASGEHFDGRALTAAHRTLPLGTYVRVTSLATAKSVVVRINDRGPFVKNRIIDLSYAAAHTLGLTRAPSMRVQIERLEASTGGKTETDGPES